MDIEPIEFSIYNGDIGKIKSLWDETFEDAPPFTDYYFDTICKLNDIVVASSNQNVVGMIHLNYYDVIYYGKEVKAVYVVGVAVIPKYRKKGIMKSMMQYALSHAERRGAKFGFLMPKDRRYYIGLGFSPVYETKRIRLKLSGESSVRHVNSYQICLLGNCSRDFLGTLAALINRALGEQYRIYCKRNAAYLEQMYLEHKCQNGDVCVLYEKSGGDMIIKGVCSYDVYGSTIYIDRYELFDDSFDIFLEMIVSISKEYSCGHCNIMIPNASYQRLFADGSHEMGALLEKNGLVEEVIDGYGIMVRVFDDEEINMDSFSGNCFFDEIV
ncbi:MAG: GNAT family N-acetyltransferase [Clostridium sp.]|nr:GNAT family N-acetyltransferase [Clostridium sp.]MCM1398160.1 GNAT family N-acetyltransferase [Clostridium sp.]MCM1460839.1 GNAT family N-acetyltransferase [Bacteroides sp.]